MTHPQVFRTRMIGFILVVVVATGVLLWTSEMIQQAFGYNRLLNGLILGVLVVGIVYILRQVAMLGPEVRWIETYRRNEPGLSVQAPPRLLSPMATMLGDEHRGRLTLSALSMRTLLDGISSRLDESREISRYLIGLLIFLGLLGTFWGLLKTIDSVGTVIQGLSVGEGDVATVFENLKGGLQAPLGGMGLAFSSSLFGLAGSLVLGFLDLQAGQAQNRFYNDLEEWLSSLTRLSSGGVGDGGQSLPAYVDALLEQTADSLDGLQRTLARGEEARMMADEKLLSLTEKLATLTDQMRAEQALMVKLAESQMDIKPVLERLSEVSLRDIVGVDEATRAHIRNIDVDMTRLLEETLSRRTQITDQLRSEVKLLARTIAAQRDLKPS